MSILLATAAGAEAAGIPVKDTVIKALGSAASLVDNIFGGGSRRASKRQKRDKLLQELRARGLDNNIVLDNSDNWGVLADYLAIEEQFPSLMIQVLNEKVNFGQRSDYPPTYRIYSKRSDQYKHNLERVEQLAKAAGYGAGSGGGSNNAGLNAGFDVSQAESQAAADKKVIFGVIVAGILLAVAVQ